ncbi:hypothetical protein F7725_013274, partial [Dissostichus mawsoni]
MAYWYCQCRNTSLNKMVAGHPKRWDQVLQSTMFGLRTKKQLTTKYSPYYLMFGREARYPSEVPKEYVVRCSNVVILFKRQRREVSRLVEREEIYEGLKKQEAVFTEVKQNMKRSQDNVRKRRVKKGQEDNFQVGDQVLRRNVRQEQRKGGKLEDDWLGPYIILELEGKKAIVARGEDPCQTTKVVRSLSSGWSTTHKDTDTHPQHTNTHHTNTHHKTTQWHLHPWTATPKWHQRILNFVIIRQIWTGRRKQMLWCKFGPYKVYSENLMDLAPGKWLEGEIVNSYLTMVGRKAGALMIDSYLMTSLWEGNHKGSLRIGLLYYMYFVYMYLDLFKPDVAVGAVCHHGHWTLIIMYLKERRSLFLNPFVATEAQIQKCKDVTSIGPEKVSGNRKVGMLTPKQRTHHHAGCLCARADFVWGNSPYPVHPMGVDMLRIQMAMCLVTNSDDLSQLCRACGELSSLAEGDIDTWIECTTCNMWYHIGCVGLPSPQRMSIFALASRDGRTLPAPARSIPASGAADP